MPNGNCQRGQLGTSQPSTFGEYGGGQWGLHRGPNSIFPSFPPDDILIRYLPCSFSYHRLQTSHGRLRTPSPVRRCPARYSVAPLELGLLELRSLVVADQLLVFPPTPFDGLVLSARSLACTQFVWIGTEKIHFGTNCGSGSSLRWRPCPSADPSPCLPRPM